MKVTVSQLAASREKNAPPYPDSGGLLSLAQQERHYELLAAGYQLLAATPTPGLTESAQEDPDRSRNDGADAALVMLMLRSLVALGLGGPARELLQHAKERNLDIDVNAVRAMLVPIPIGRVPWSDLKDTFDANVTALRDVQPELVGGLSDIEQAAQGCQLFRTTVGTLLLAGPRDAGLRAWNPGLIDPAVFSRVPIAQPKGGQPMLVVGLGAPGMLQRVIDETETPATEPGVLLLIADTDAARAFAALHTTNLAPLIELGRTRLFLGETATQQFADFLARNTDVDLPSDAVIMQWSKELGETMSHIVREERTRREQEFAAVTTALRTRTETRTALDHATRLRKGATILGFTSRFTTMLQYSMRDIGDALREHGYNFVLVREADAQRTHSSLTVARALAVHDPALVIMINHFRRERARAMPGVPVLTWIQDPTPTVLSRETGESLTELDFACGYYITECTEQFGYPRKQFFSLCLPVSSHIFHDAPLSRDDEKLFACDVMYVGHRHASEDEHVQSWREATPATLHPLLDKLRSHANKLVQRNQPVGDAAQAVRDVAHSIKLNLSPANVDRLANYFFTRVHDILFRAQTLRWVAEWARNASKSFKLYGKGWEDDEMLAPFAVGPVEHGEPLRKAYRGAKIVLQTLPAGFMHQRTFEGLASGSLVLARHSATSSASDHFSGVERVIFAGKDELLAKLDQYLADDAMRARTTDEMRRVVLGRFTYSAVMPELIENIRSCLRHAV